MKIDIKNKWLTALRSGEYRKSINVLKRHFKTKPGHCCLGVLCEVIKDDYPHAAELINIKTGEQYRRTPISSFAMLDTSVLEYTGIEPNQQRTLSSMNDSGAPFSKIANYIEKNL